MAGTTVASFTGELSLPLRLWFLCGIHLAIHALMPWLDDHQ